MKKLLEILAAILLSVLIGLGAGLAWWGYKEAPLIHDALWNFASSSYDVKQNSGKELVETNKVLADTHDLILETKCSLNGCPGLFGRKAVPGLLPEVTILVHKTEPAIDNLTNTIAHLNTAAMHLDELMQSGTATMDELKGTVGQFNKAIADLDGIVADPKIREIIANLKDATADLDGSIQQMNVLLKSATATAEDVRQVADSMRAKYLKARNLYYALASELLSKGSEVMQFLLKK